MKKLKFFGLLAAVLLLAFGMMVGCSSDTPTDNADEVKTEFSGMSSGQLVVFTFSNKAIPAKARAAGPNSGDNYLITVGGSKVSSGYITMPTTDLIVFHPDDGQPTFQASLGNNNIVLNDTVGDTSLNVIASPGANNTGGGVGGGGGGGGGGGLGGGGTGGGTGSGGGSSTTPPKVATVLNSYTVEQDGGTNGATPSTGLKFTFETAIPDFSAKDVTITNGTGVAEKKIELTPTGTDGKVWTLGLDSTKSVQGHVSVKVNRRDVDPAERKVGVFSLLSGVPEPAPTVAITVIKSGVTTPAAITDYFKEDGTALAITFADAVPSFTIAGNLRWNTPLDKFGQTAEIKVTGLNAPADNKTFTATVEVIKQGPVEFYLVGEGFSPELTPATFATKKDTLKYKVYRGDGVNSAKAGQKNLLTTTALRFVFDVDPAILGGTALANTHITVTAVDTGAWAKGTLAAGASANERVLPLDETSGGLEKVRQGPYTVAIALADIDPMPQDVDIFRAALYKPVISTLDTLGVTTHLKIEIPKAAKFITAFAHGNVALRAANGVAITVATKVDDIIGNLEVGTPDPDDPAVLYYRYIVPLAKPLLKKDSGSATVIITQDDIDPAPVAVQLNHGGGIGYKASIVASTAGAAELTIQFDRPLINPYSATAQPQYVGGASGNDLPTVTALSGLTVTTPTSFPAALTATAAGLAAGTYTLTLADSANGFDTAPAGPITVKFEIPASNGLANYFIDPAAVVVAFTPFE